MSSQHTLLSFNLLKMFKIFKGCQRITNAPRTVPFSRSLFTCHSGNSINTQQVQQQSHPKHQNENQNHKKHLLQGTSGPLLNYQSARQVRNFYKPSAIRRIFKHGLEARLSTRGGKEILWRRILKGRHNLTVFDQFLEEPILMTEQKKREFGFNRINIPKKFYKHKDYEKNKHKFN